MLLSYPREAVVEWDGGRLKVSGRNETGSWLEVSVKEASSHQLLVLHVCWQVLLFNQAAGCHADQQDVTVINKPVLQLTDQTTGICISFGVHRRLCFLHANQKSSKETAKGELLTESGDGQDDGDRYGHPGHPQSFLAITLCFVRLQAHAAFQKTCRQQHRAQWPMMCREISRWKY